MHKMKYVQVQDPKGKLYHHEFLEQVMAHQFMQKNSGSLHSHVKLTELWEKLIVSVY